MGAVRALTVTVAVAAVLVTGCGRKDAPGVPVACKEGPASIATALERAPAPVRLQDDTRISSCLARGSEAGEMEIVGTSLLTVAQDLADDARRRPDGQTVRRLGYLIGAARHGADGSGGLHDDLVRRLESELHGVETRSPAFREGEAAGRESG